MVQKFINKFLIASIILSSIIAILGIGYSRLIIDVERRNCYKTLLSAAAEASSKIESNFKNDKASLRMLAKVISQSDNLESNEVNNQLGTYAVNNYINNIAILNSDNKILQSRHVNSENNIISFEEESVKGEHISNLQPSTFLDNKYVLRNYVPIGGKDGIRALLFTELDVDALVKAWSPSIYDGHASFCIIDTVSKEILINGWNTKYKMLDDIPSSIITNGVVNKDTGYTKMVLNEKEIFVAYTPMSIENWSMLIAVDSDIVLEPADATNTHLLNYLLISLFIFIIYLVWIMRYNILAIREARESANKDALTGLNNRNSYEEFCSKKLEKNISCIYIDVNGLHEINNEKGHLAGDLMLKFIADMLSCDFKEEKIFRIGGDEFIIFSDSELDILIDKMKSLSEDIVKSNYHISYGIYRGTDLKTIIKQSEVLMYDMKKKYYEDLGKEVRNKLVD